MMKKKLLVITLIIMLVISLLVSTASALTFIATMDLSRTTVPESTEFTVVIKISNLDVGNDGINTMQGILTYNTQIFETLTTSSISGMNGWQPSFDTTTGKVVLHNQSFVKENQDVLQITFKTKTNVTGKSGEINFKSIQASNSQAEIVASDISAKVTVGNASSGNELGNTTGNTNTNSAQPITPKPANIATNLVANVNNAPVTPNVNNTPSTNQTNQSSDDIPYTGTSDNIMRAIFVVLVIAGISYFKYESIKDK